LIQHQLSTSVLIAKKICMKSARNTMTNVSPNPVRNPARPEKSGPTRRTTLVGAF